MLSDRIRRAFAAQKNRNADSRGERDSVFDKRRAELPALREMGVSAGVGRRRGGARGLPDNQPDRACAERSVHVRTDQAAGRRSGAGDRRLLHVPYVPSEQADLRAAGHDMELFYQKKHIDWRVDAQTVRKTRKTAK